MRKSKRYGFRSLRVKLVAATVVVEVLMLSLLIWNNIRLTQDALIDQTEFRIQEIIPLLNASIAGPLLQEDIASLHEIIKQLINDYGLRYIAIFNEEKELVIKLGTSTSDYPLYGLFRDQIKSGDMAKPYRLMMPVVLSDQEIGFVQLELDTRFINQTIATASQQSIVIASTAVILSILLLLLIGVALTRHLSHLTEIVSVFPSQKLVPKLTISTGDEISALYEAFLVMAAQIKLREQQREVAELALRDSERRVRLLLDSTAEAIYGIDINGQCIFANPACIRILGYKSVIELNGKNMHQLIHHSHADGSPYVEDHSLIVKSYKQGTGSHVINEVLWRADGSSVPVEYWSYPIMEDNSIIGSVVTFIDITERKHTEEELVRYRDHLEELVTERTLALEASNKELESYSYSIAHDLRTPLRAVTSFSQILLEDVGPKLGDSEKDSLYRIVNAGKKMASLIDDILELSRISRQQLDKQSINLSAIAQTIKQNLTDNHPQRQVQWIIQEGVVAQGDEKLVEVVLENLLNNAWKYSGKTQNSIIEFGIILDHSEKVFFVKDNGVGFDMRFADKLFTAFQRLHSADEFEGVGVGLATVSRIIHRHGGRIWAESKKDKGARFYFTLESVRNNLTRLEKV